MSRMGGVFPVEIRNFFSLSKLGTFVDESTSWYEGLLKEYNQRLGDLLREEGSDEEEVSKKLQEKGLTRQKSSSKKKSSSKDWFSFKGLMFSAEKESKPEVFFEALDKIKKNLERLKETKTLIGELEKVGLGSDLVYSIYFVEGVPERIFVESTKKAKPRYKFEMFLSTSMESLEAMEKTVEETAASEETAEEDKPVEKKKSRKKGKPRKQKPKKKGKPKKEE